MRRASEGTRDWGNGRAPGRRKTVIKEWDEAGARTAGADNSESTFPTGGETTRSSCRILGRCCCLARYRRNGQRCVSEAGWSLCILRLAEGKKPRQQLHPTLDLVTSTNPSPPDSSTLTTSLRRRPFLLFGAPFLAVVVLSSFALSSFTQTRYDYRDQKVTAMSKEEELGMRRDRRKVDVREEYYVRSFSSASFFHSSVLCPVLVLPCPPLLPLVTPPLSPRLY
jgi:hypothetical protein